MGALHYPQLICIFKGKVMINHHMFALCLDKTKFLLRSRATEQPVAVLQIEESHRHVAPSFDFTIVNCLSPFSFPRKNMMLWRLYPYIVVSRIKYVCSYFFLQIILCLFYVCLMPSLKKHGGHGVLKHWVIPQENDGKCPIFLGGLNLTFRRPIHDITW